MKKSDKKFCPKCGTPNNLDDSYCIKCGHSFIRNKKKTNGNLIWIVLILIIIGWIVLRIFLKKPIIPEELFNVVKNFTANKTG